jgi:tRNA pseudouridine synthase 10
MEHKFHSGGREDIDVRMLGSGRPFVVEMIHPRKRISVTDEDLLKLAEQVNNQGSEVSIRELFFTDKTCFEDLTKSADTKVKAYAAIVQTDHPITPDKIQKVDELRDIEVDQMTPLRVLHRRTLMSRDKVIFRCVLKPINEFTAVCFMLSSAGTYIKEFVHGDLNRTKPNLGMLLDCKCDIMQLDVIELYEELNDQTFQSFSELVESFKIGNN